MCVSCIQNKIGRLELIVGCMFAGKTEEFLKRIRKMQYAKMDTIIFKPLIDNRYTKNNVVSHNTNSMKCISVKNSEEIKNYLNKNPNYSVIGIDEVQFFDHKIVKLIDNLVEKKYIIIATGLDLDYQSKPFQNIKDLLPVSEFITKLHAVCIKCGNLANRTQRINNNDLKLSNDRILIGSSDIYEARCRNCYKK